MCIQNIVFKIGMFLNIFPKMPFPLIYLTETNFDFNLLQFMQLPITYGLLFLATFPFMFFDFVIFLQDRQEISIMYYNLY